MVIRKKLLFLIVLLLLVACGNQNKTQEEIQKDWKIFETDNYSIKYPHSWALDQSGYLGTSFLIISKQTSIRDLYQENVSLVEKQLSDSEIDLKLYLQQDVKALRDSIPYIEISMDSLNENSKQNFHQLIYETQEGINKIAIEKYYFLKGSIAYILTFSCKSREQKRYMPIGEGILNSFEFKE